MSATNIVDLVPLSVVSQDISTHGNEKNTITVTSLNLLSTTRSAITIT